MQSAAGLHDVASVDFNSQQVASIATQSLIRMHDICKFSMHSVKNRHSDLIIVADS